jgi:hypothetical protein
MQRLALMTVLLSFLMASPVWAHEDEVYESTEINIEETVQTECECKEHKSDQEHGEHKHKKEKHSKAFLEGTPNLTSPAAVDSDSLYLLYSHNFYQSSFPRGSNPAFWFRYSPLDRLQIDGLASLRTPLELEVGVGYQILSEAEGDWFNLMPRIAYNSRGNLVGAELAANKYLFNEIWQVGLDARILSTGQPDGFDRPVAAMGFNTMVRVWKDWHLFGDVVVPFDSEILQKRSVLWSAGIKKRIPHTPHILTLFAGNSQEQSLAGRTISASNILSDVFRVGFVFSINIEDLSTLPAKLF